MSARKRKPTQPVPAVSPQAAALPKGPAPIWIAIALAVVTLAVFSPATTFQFLNYDDTDFVTANPYVQAGFTVKGFLWVWHSEVARNWHPVTMLSHMFDCWLFGVKPWWPHLVNAILHSVNTVMLFYLLKRMTGAMWQSATVAALFALHPLHVESVAWIAERKDVLSTLFWFLTTWAYLGYVENQEKQTAKRWVCYGASLSFFALGLMSKPMLVTLPFTLLLLDYWPLGRMKVQGIFGRRGSAAPPLTGGKMLLPQPPNIFPAVPSKSLLWLTIEKIPFFALSAGLCAVTYRIQQEGGAMLRLQDFPLGSRFGNALVSYVRYLEKMFWPRNLAGLYLRSGQWPWWEVTLAGLFLIVVSAVAMAQWRRRPYMALGWFWYFGTLVPVIGLVQVGMQAMADRFTYVPLIGLFMILVWGGWEWATAKHLEKFVPSATVAVLLVCTALTVHQEFFWKDSETLFKRMVDATPNNYMARYNLGNLYNRDKRTDEAISNFLAAIQDEPNYAEAHNNLGGIYLEQKRYDEALAHYRTAARVNSQYLYFFNLANALADAASARQDSNQFAEAVQTYHQALQFNPNSSEAHHNLGLTWQAQDKVNEAAVEFEQAASLDSNRVDSWNQLGLLCAQHNNMQEAERAFRELVRLQPNNPEVYGWLGNALGEQNKLAEAIPVYETALRLHPEDSRTEFNLALTFSKMGKRDEAAAHYRQALRINPGYTDAQTALRQLEGNSAR